MGVGTDEFQVALKEGKRALKARKLSRAEFWLQRAREHARGDKNKRALVIHRLAEIAILNDEIMLARERFKRALELIDKENIVGRAILRRDYGEFERHQGNLVIARKRVVSAIELLESLTTKSNRATFELIVTRGFEARLDLGTERHDYAVETLKVTAEKLYGYKKRQYELANLAILIDVLPLWEIDRVKYVARAVYLSSQLGALGRAAEFTSLFGGSHLQGLYQRIVK